MKGNESQAKAATYRSLSPNRAFRLLLNHYLNLHYRQHGNDQLRSTGLKLLEKFTNRCALASVSRFSDGI